MAKTTKKTKKNIEKTIKKLNKITLVLVFILFIVGLCAGVGTCYYLTKDDIFKINGETEITLNVGDTYIEQGATIVAFGKDISSSVKITGNVDTTQKGKYVIKYQVDNFRYKNYTLYKLVTVLEEEV